MSPSYRASALLTIVAALFALPVAATDVGTGLDEQLAIPSNQINPPPYHRIAVEARKENTPFAPNSGVPDPKVTLRSPFLRVPMRSLSVRSSEKSSFHPLATENPKHRATGPIILWTQVS